MEINTETINQINNDYFSVDKSQEEEINIDNDQNKKEIELDHLQFIFSIKKIVDFANTLCQCEEIEHDKMCDFCKYLVRHDKKTKTMKGLVYDELMREFLDKFGSLKGLCK